MNFLNSAAELIYWLSDEKVYMPQLETNIIDACNLNCKGCTHFAGIFNKDDFYEYETFRRDLRTVSAKADISIFYLMGGEPLLKADIVKYIETARKYLPQSNVHLITNGLLIPSVSDEIFDIMRQNRIVVEMSLYPPTVKMLDKIEGKLKQQNIPYIKRQEVKYFNVFLTTKRQHKPEESRSVCGNDVCRFMRDGKIYKCPLDALSPKYKNYFKIKEMDSCDTGIDIYANNFSVLVELLDGNIELCNYCNEKTRQIDWTSTTIPLKEDWLA